MSDVIFGESYDHLTEYEKDIYSTISFSNSITCISATFWGHGLEGWNQFIRESENPPHALYGVYLLYKGLGYFCPKHAGPYLLEKELGMEYIEYKSRNDIFNIFKKGSLFTPTPMTSGFSSVLGPIGFILGLGFESLILESATDPDDVKFNNLIKDLIDRLPQMINSWKDICKADKSDSYNAYDALVEDGILK